MPIDYPFDEELAEEIYEDEEISQKLAFLTDIGEEPVDIPTDAPLMDVPEDVFDDKEDYSEITSQYTEDDFNIFDDEDENEEDEDDELLTLDQKIEKTQLKDADLDTWTKEYLIKIGVLEENQENKPEAEPGE